MNRTIVHRGPDGEGFYIHKNVALGHRRLSIIDLSTGEQPMYNEDKSIVIVFNGEIYNYIELKEELTALGCRFTTTSDTEVIIKAYETWGFACQNHFNGMWAFALWDENINQLFLSRDRLGEKPLYYSIHDNTLVFGSEIKTILAYGVTTEPRLDVLELYFILGFIPSPYTFYKDISQVKPGHYILSSSEGIKIEKYWDLPSISESNLINDKKLVENDFAEIFNDAVKIRMRSDVSFGAFLSGGLDSSCVVATMNHHTKKPIETFTIGFDHQDFDERSLAKLVAAKFETNHHEMVVSPDNLEIVIKKILHHYDEPFGDPSAIPTGSVSKFASEYVKMVLTGDGGDEVLSGYTSYLGEVFASHYKKVPGIIRAILPIVIKNIAHPFRGRIRYQLNRIEKVLSASNKPFPERLLVKMSRTNLTDLKCLLNQNHKQISFNEFYNEVMKDCLFADPFYKLMFFQLKVTLPDNMLTKVDRMSMAHSIETRTPFLDYRLVELLYKVNKNLKVKGYVNKIVLRNAIANKSLPDQLLRVSKKGFDVPLRDWFRDKDLLKEVTNSFLNDNHQRFFNPSIIQKVIKENTLKQSDKGNLIWMTLLLQKWLHTIHDSNRKPIVAEQV